jgi:GntR family transcriptional regulator, rspAB operon transcriptional repressor
MGSVMAFELDRQQNIPNQVYDLLREKILSVELKPGASISERRLTEWLGVSRTPIREAIRRLADNGLISIIPHVGTSVSLISAKRIRELYLIRSSLECAVIRTSAERFDEHAAKALQDLIDQQTATLAAGPDFVRHVVVDDEFHRSIAGFSGMTLAWEILQNVMSEVTRLRHLSIRIPGRSTQPIKEHLDILQALKSNDPDASQRAMKAHLDNSFQSILTALELYPDYLEK